MAEIEPNIGADDGNQAFVSAALMCFSEPETGKKGAHLNLVSRKNTGTGNNSNSSALQNAPKGITLTGVTSSTPKPTLDVSKGSQGEATRKKPHRETFSLQKPATKKQPSKHKDDSAAVKQPEALNTEGLTLTPEEKISLGLHPEIATELLAAIKTPDIFNVYLRRVFIPLASSQPGGLREDTVAAMRKAGWLWEDFTSNAESPVVVVKHKEGVILAAWLGEIIARNTNTNLGFATRAELGEEEAEALQGLVSPLLSAATPETINNNAVLTITMHKIKLVAEEHGRSADDGLNALQLHRDIVVSWKRKAAYILPLEGDIKRQKNNV